MVTINNNKTHLLKYLAYLATFVCGTILGPIVYKSVFSLWDQIQFNNRQKLFFFRRTHTSKCDVPENAPEDCPGLESDKAGKAEACAGCPNKDICSSGAAKTPDPKLEKIVQNMIQVKKKILVLSGKGGVGKSTVATQLSWLLQERGFDVGLLDIDICGPSVPLMTGTRLMNVHSSADGWSPVYVEPNFGVMSIGFLLPDEGEAVIWRGPKKNGLIRQFLSDVSWGPLDILIVDTPPGTSDEHLSVVTYMKDLEIDGALIISTPQEVSLLDVRKEISFCKHVGIPILGFIENMTESVFDINQRDSTFKDEKKISRAQEMCNKLDVSYAGKIPMDNALFNACEKGVSVTKLSQPDSSLIVHLTNIVDSLLNKVGFSLSKVVKEEPNNNETLFKTSVNKIEQAVA